MSTSWPAALRAAPISGRPRRTKYECDQRCMLGELGSSKRIFMTAFGCALPAARLTASPPRRSRAATEDHYITVTRAPHRLIPWTAPPGRAWRRPARGRDPGATRRGTSGFRQTGDPQRHRELQVGQVRRGRPPAVGRRHGLRLAAGRGGRAAGARGSRRLRLRAPAGLARRGRVHAPRRALRLEDPAKLDRLAAERGAGLNLACGALAAPGEAVMTVTPVYPPFLTAPANQARRLIAVPATVSGGPWRLPLEAMEAAVTPDTRVFLLCHPHNPLGRAWSAEEVAAVLDFCRRHDLILCSDEIHCDLILDDVAHVPAAAAADDTAGRVVTLMAPSKTFNLPGLNFAFAVVADPELRKRYMQPAAGLFPMPGCFAVAGCM